MSSASSSYDSKSSNVAETPSNDSSSLISVARRSADDVDDMSSLIAASAEPSYSYVYVVVCSTASPSADVSYVASFFSAELVFSDFSAVSSFFYVVSFFLNRLSKIPK